MLNRGVRHDALSANRIQASTVWSAILGLTTTRCAVLAFAVYAPRVPALAGVKDSILLGLDSVNRPESGGHDLVVGAGRC
jgi:hypothetical protein